MTTADTDPQDTTLIARSDNIAAIIYIGKPLSGGDDKQHLHIFGNRLLELLQDMDIIFYDQGIE